MSNVSKIIRGHRPQQNFYILDKKISEDSRLSWEARGVLIFLLGKPDDWVVSVAHLVKIGSAGRDKMYKIINELIDFGYCLRTKGPKGHGCDYVISEVPLTENQEVENPLPENPLPENPFPENPLPENPLPENPFPENPTLVSTDNKQELSTTKKNKQKKSDLDWSILELSEKQKETIKAIRNSTKSKLTQASLDPILKQLILATKAGISVDESLDIWANRGWIGFTADWAIKHKHGNNYGQGSQNTPQKPSRGVTAADVFAMGESANDSQSPEASATPIREINPRLRDGIHQSVCEQGAHGTSEGELGSRVCEGANRPAANEASLGWPQESSNEGRYAESTPAKFDRVSGNVPTEEPVGEFEFT